MAKDINQRDDFDKLIQSSFAEQPVQADAVVWDNIAAAIAPKKKRIAIWWWYGAAASVTLLLGAAFYFNQTTKLQNQSAPEFVLEDCDSVDNEFKNNTSVDVNAVANSDAGKTTESDEHPINSNKENDPSKGFATMEESNLSYETKAGEKLGQKPEKFESTPDGNNALNRLANAENNSNINAKAFIGDSSLSSMPMLAAQVEASLLSNEFERRNLPRFVDVADAKPDYSTSKFLAANLASAGGATGSAYGVSGNRFGFAEDASPTSLGNSDDYNFQSDEITTYSPPFVFGVKGALSLSKRWYFESGLNYSLLSKSITSELGLVKPTTITEHYIGLPLLFDFEFVQKRKLSLLATAGWQVEKGIAARSIVSDNTGRTVTHLQAPGVQIGWIIGVSAEYRINEQFGFYMQPSLTFWTFSSRYIQNIRNYSLAWPSLQMGLRYRIR
jgi:hypothetical protein